MSEKPSYLGLLNAIAVAESAARTSTSRRGSRSHRARKCARCCAPSPRAKASTGWRSRSASTSSASRCGARTTPSAPSGSRSRASDCTDLEKMKALGLHRLDSGDEPDIFDGFFKDHSIDIRTGELLGRYIAEERDSARLLRGCYEQLKKAAKAGEPSASASDDRLAVARGEDRHRLPSRRGAAPDRVRAVDAHGVQLALSSPAVGGGFENQRAIFVGDLDRRRELDRLGAHLAQRLAHDVDHLLAIEAPPEVVELGLDEHETQRVLEQLRVADPFRGRASPRFVARARSSRRRSRCAAGSGPTSSAWSWWSSLRHRR